ncbi:MAG: hypothetical protein Q9218_004335 [Villophora microphyllina]
MPGQFHQRNLASEETLKVISWNINSRAPGRAKRTSAALDHLKALFETYPHPSMVVMLQEVHKDSLPVILAKPWVQDNFVISELENAQEISNFMMISKHLRYRSWSRVALQSPTGKDALCVDIEVSPPGARTEWPVKQYLRVCTTQLELGQEAKDEELRLLQLAQISALLKAPVTGQVRIVGGIMGGDLDRFSTLNAAGEGGNDSTKLLDVWKRYPPPNIWYPFKRSVTGGRAEGDTWGHNTTVHFIEKHRPDRFLYTGCLDIVALNGNDDLDLSGKIGRLGIGQQIHLEGQDEDVYVSDHFGIAIGVQVRW